MIKYLIKTAVGLFAVVTFCYCDDDKETSKSASCEITSFETGDIKSTMSVGTHLKSLSRKERIYGNDMKVYTE
jgi:hypothetical protein